MYRGRQYARRVKRRPRATQLLTRAPTPTTVTTAPSNEGKPLIKIDLENWTTLAGQLVSPSEALETPTKEQSRISKNHN